jgi:lipopolysaccharide assembly outer membrane protein LptD (OstA)
MSSLSIRHIVLSLLLPATLTTVTSLSIIINSVSAQRLDTQPSATTPIKQTTQPVADVYIWQGNVKFDFKAAKINATADKAEVFPKERKVVLTGNVRILQNGKIQETDTVTYLFKQQDKFNLTADKVIASNFR